MATNEEPILRLAEFTDGDAKRFRALSSEGKRGGAEMLAILRRNPLAAAKAGDLSRHIGAKIITRLAGGDAESVTAECFRQRCADLRRELGYDDAPAVERLLIDRIIVTWLHLHDVESSRQVEGLTLGQSAFYDKAVGMAQSDHVRALLALAKVRKLALPAVQVNVTTGNQLNLAV